MSSEAPRLYLTTPSLVDADAFGLQLEAALAAGDVACVLARPAGRDEGKTKRILRKLGQIAAGADVALLVEAAPQVAVRGGADGVHVRGAGAALEEALESLKPERIVGCGGLLLRDDAMRAGEAGVDYVMFGDPSPGERAPALADTLELTAWWAEIFTVACVAFAGRIEDVAALAEAGADFVALGDWLWSDPPLTATLVGQAQAALDRTARVTG